MKCKRCGFRGKDINGMRKHYLKKHPGAMKRKKRIPFKDYAEQGFVGLNASGRRIAKAGYCPMCGRPL